MEGGREEGEGREGWRKRFRNGRREVWMKGGREEERGGKDGGRDLGMDEGTERGRYG